MQRENANDRYFVGWTQVSLVPSTDGSNETLGQKNSTIAYLAEVETYLRAQSFPDKPLTLLVEIDLRKTQNGGANTYLTISVGPRSKKEFCLGGLSPLGLQSKHGQEHIEFLRERLIPGIIMSAFMMTTLENAKYTLNDNAPESYSVIIPKGKDRGPGGSKRIVNSSEKIAALTREYDWLQCDKTFGDDRDRALWEIICYRFDNGDPKWRERAKIDSDAVPDAVLDLVEKRQKFNLKVSHLALYAAATRAQIEFKICSHKRTGKRFLKPSPSTLLRRYKEGQELLKSGAKT